MIVLQGARERVDVLQFSSDGRSLIAPCSTGVQVWNDPASGRLAAVLDYPSVHSVRFTPDGKKLVLAGFGMVVHDLDTGDAVRVPAEFYWYWFWGLSPDGLLLVTSQCDIRQDRPGLLWCRPLADLVSPRWSIEPSRPVYSPPLFLPGGGRFVLFEGRPDSIPHWYVTRDAKTGLVLQEVPGSGHHYHSPVLSADRRLIAARWGVWVAVFRADDMGADPVKIRNDNRKEFTGLAFHPSGRYLAATSNDATVKLYDTTSWKVAESFDWDVGRLRSIAFSPDGMLAAAGGDRGRIVVWDVDL